MSGDQQQLCAIVLAAGKGKRMKSDLPKVLHELAGKPIVQHVLDMLSELDVERVIVVVGHQAKKVIESIRSPGVVFVEQKQQLGTGHAVKVAEDELADTAGDVLVLNGDVPLLRPETVRGLIAEHRRRNSAGTVLTASLSNPAGYGRIVRGENGKVLRIVEHKDATEAERQIAEINSGTFVFKRTPLFEALTRIDSDNRQGEYYLTDVMKILLELGMPIAAYRAEDYRETLGVNSAEELDLIERVIKAKLA
jgi:bifunctional UDP-N-acetylglucosamine pyrophosphorylase/glucosamine-1-phosphate N-acetyltransferase